MPGSEPALFGGTADGACCCHQWPNCKHHQPPAFCLLRFPFSLVFCRFHFTAANCHPLLFDTFQKLVDGCVHCLLSYPQRRMSRGVNPSLVSWLTTMMGLRLQVVLEHMPVGPDAILRYVRRVGDPPQVKGLTGCGARALDGTAQI